MSAWIQQIESHLGVPLLADLRELYERRDGESPDDFRPYSASRAMRLMSADEVTGYHDELLTFANPRGSCQFWIGGNREFASAFLTGPLAGRVFIRDYDGRNDSIAFRSVRSFVESMNELAAGDPKSNDWPDLVTDYYVDSEYFYRGKAICKPATAEETASDVEAARQLRAEYAAAQNLDEPDEHHYALNIMALIPASATEEVLEFLDSEDMWIQARACNILGHRRYEPATSRLGEIVRTGTTNGRGAALRALGRLGTPAALEQVVQSIGHYFQGGSRDLADALAACGCDIRKENEDPRNIQQPDYFYRRPGDSEWRKI